jgi:biopolymer transport protein ExbB/TolQ
MVALFHSGGPVMYPLLACSFIVMTVIVERALFWIKTSLRRNRPLVDDVMELAATGIGKRCAKKPWAAATSLYASWSAAYCTASSP